MSKKRSNIVKILALPVGLFFLFFFLADGFGLHSLPIIISQCILPSVMGFGLGILMNAGLMDFSMGARTVFAGIIGGMLAGSFGILGLVAGCFLGALGVSLVMALLYRFLKIPCMVISLGIVLIFEVFGAKLAGSSGYMKVGKEIYWIASYPYSILIWSAVLLLAYLIYYKMCIGSHIIAVGNDEMMCKNVGISADRVKFNGILLTGLFCGAAGLLSICYSGSVTAATEMSTMGMTFKPIMCVILGRFFAKTLDNMPVMIVVGSMCISIIFNGFIAMGFSDAVQDIVLGVFLILVLGSNAIIDSFGRKKIRKAGAVET